MKSLKFNWKYIKEDGPPEFAGQYLAGSQIKEDGKDWCEPLAIPVLWTGDMFEITDKYLKPNTAQVYIDGIYCYIDIDDIEIPEPNIDASIPETNVRIIQQNAITDDLVVCESCDGQFIGIHNYCPHCAKRIMEIRREKNDIYSEDIP